jgi:DNA-binding beta-propeller fold protein YncE
MKLKAALIAAITVTIPAFAGPSLLVTTGTTLFTVDATGAATALGSTSQYTSARGVAVGPDGNYYVADLGTGTVNQVNPNTGVATAFASVSGAYGLAWFGNQLYVSSFNGSGTLTTLDSTGTSVGSFSTGFSNLTDLAFDSNGSLFVSSGGAHGVLKVDLTGQTASLFANTQANGGASDGNGNPISTPRGIAFEGGNLFVDDSANCSGACTSGGQEIAEYDGTTGAYIATLVSGLSSPKGMLFDSDTNAFFVAASSGSGIDEVDLQGNVTLYSALAGTQDLALLTSATPEPSTWMMMLAGIGGIGLGFRRKRK